ncbi:AraC family transcriptional regulator [Alkalibaculum sp. M08DMB]|uniref:AraC family transcriptional regulator n=1 Tax=Alkalibaculum sporogenes TaxID=2655001 RepID=A0A6A7KBF6_9FIRM|nr:GyrI-like domain-containing protein [Alkalibaculum sporogenes]MPW26736.1 AraC family transcriptional regulator [Alkalibaculum sporogenes]
MNYEIVNLEEKIIVGVSTETSNEDPKMGEKIGKLWAELYQGGVNAKINNKVNNYAIGLYSNYTENGYIVTAGNEVEKSENDELTTKVIPAGRYAKFSVRGHMEKAVAQAWGKIWSMDLDRSFTGDFEEYINSDFANADIDIYIALK